jgi:threonine/homoserine/homoserine lactone efflux protein
MHIATFVGLSILLTTAPGPNFALMTRNALQHGRRGAIETGLGVGAGVALWAAACAVGIAAVVRDAPGLFLAFKIVGTAYLAYLGLSALWESRNTSTTLQVAGVASARQAIWVQGFVSTLLNPKLGVFFVVFLPEFIDSTKPALPQSALLGAIYLAIDQTWMMGYGLVVATIGGTFMSGAVRRWLQRICGVVLLFFAVVLITTSSH